MTIATGVRRDRELIHLWRSSGYAHMAEVGVERGAYSETLLAQWPDLHLTCVDAWAAYPGYREHVTQAKLDRFYAETQQRLAPFRDRCDIVRMFSTDAAANYRDEAFDVVYLDANHTLPSVIADLAAWLPKVRVGGMIAGHDFGRSSVGHVREAVEAWTRAYGITDWHVTDERSPSWFWVKA